MVSRIPRWLFVAFGMLPLSVSAADQPLELSGIYPHLAMFNIEDECGTGAVAEFAGRVWVVTYAPLAPEGSSDKLYEITPQLSKSSGRKALAEHPRIGWFIASRGNYSSALMQLMNNASSARSLISACSGGQRAMHATSPIRPAKSITRRWKRGFTKSMYKRS